MSIENLTNKNPFQICTWQDESKCTGCPLADRLNCRFNWNDLLYFLVLFLTPTIAAVIGMIQGGFSIYLIGWAGYALFFFFVWEARVLCSHCPYWAEEGRVLHCLANHGVLKIWRYRPGPMSTAEKIQFLIGAGILVLYPFPFLIMAKQYTLTAIALSGILGFAFSLKKHVCTRCVNFSCPLNGVPKIVVDAYLRGNPVMRQAWEAKGYQLDSR
jgi:hypothetical protein